MIAPGRRKRPAIYLRSRMMVGNRTGFTGQQAPCGKIVNGAHIEDSDDQGLVVHGEYYECGCRQIRHEYHDGGVGTRSIRHDGHKVKEQPSPDHWC
jgi:hypothetical protein